MLGLPRLLKSLLHIKNHSSSSWLWRWCWINVFCLASWLCFFKYRLYPFIRMKSCDMWLRQMRKPLPDTMRYWLVYPHEKGTRFFVARQKNTMLAQRLFTFSQCWLVRTTRDQLSYITFHIRVCMMRDPLGVLFPV